MLEYIFLVLHYMGKYTVESLCSDARGQTPVSSAEVSRFWKLARVTASDCIHMLQDHELHPESSDNTLTP